MPLTISRSTRDALYDTLLTDLTPIGDLWMALEKNEVVEALELRKRFEADLRLLDDLGWGEQTEDRRFTLTMPPADLRRIVERLYWSSQASLADPEGLIPEAREYLQRVSVSCPEILAKLAELRSCESLGECATA